MTEKPPSAPGLPVVGSIPKLITNPADFLLGNQRRLGNIYTLNLGLADLVVLSGPAHAQYLLRDNVHNFTKAGPVWDLLRTVIGSGLATSDGPPWLRQRRLMQPVFTRGRTAELTELMVRAVETQLGPWEHAAGSTRQLDVSRACAQVAMKIMMMTMFGEETRPDELAEMSAAVTFMLEYATWAIIASAMPGWVPLPGKRRYRKTLRTIEDYVSAVITARRAEEGHDLISMLARERDGQGKGLTDKEIRDEAFTIFMAGYETTALTLAWSLHYLVRNPEMHVRALREVDDVLGGARPTYADIASLTYVFQVLQETLRLRPPAYWLPRTTIEDDIIDGYRIPGGKNLALLIFGVQQDPEHWEHPEVYDPDRFAPGAPAPRHPFAYIPFGAGKRQCIGKDFAIVESVIALSMILQRFHHHDVPGHVKPRLMSTLRPKGGLPLRVSERTRDVQEKRQHAE